MKIFETHCHLDFPDYNKDRDEVIKKCIDAGVHHFINVGTETDTIKKSIRLAEQYTNIYAAVGYHPNYCDGYDEELFRTSLAHPKVVAIGEIGLDYYRNYMPKALQRKVFHQELEIAQETNLPVIIHNRDAHHDCWEIMSKYNLQNVVFHCFAGGLDFARQIWDKGWYISVTAAITYKNCKINDVIKECPLHKIMSETDCPFLAPQIIRGQRNDPSYLPYVIERIAELKELPVEDVASALFHNACRFFLKIT